MRSLLLWPFWLIALVWGVACAEGVVHLIPSEDGGAYQGVADAFRTEFGSQRAVRLWSPATLDDRQIQALTAENDLIVPIGLKAARAVATNHAGRAAVLMLMIPRVSAEHLDWPATLPRRKISSVPIDQPASRYLGLVAAALPRAKRIGLVISGENEETASAMQLEAARRHFSFALEKVERPEQVAPSLRAVLPDSDVLLLVPDSVAMNGENARNVLITTYRYRVPTIGFSEGLSRAGSVASIYSTPAQIGRQGARMAAQWNPGSGELPAAQAAEEFSVSYNQQVARSLGVGLADLDEVRRKLGAVRSE
jgi:ABC-type uncharacterized transport system substrate-binding protein